MSGYLERVTIRNLASPYGLAIASLFVFLLCWAAPPTLFLDFVGEADILHLNSLVLLFYVSCVSLFIAGVRASSLFRYSRSGYLRTVTASAPIGFLLFPLGVSTMLCAGSVLALSGSISNLANLLLSQQGALIKLAGASGQAEEGSWGYMITLHTGVLWWAYARSRSMSLPGILGRIFTLCFCGGLAVALGTAVAKVDRTNLIPIIAGLFILYLYSKVSRRDDSLSKLLMLCTALAAAVLLSFSAVSFLRGASNARLLFAGIFGYTAVSYNRMAAELTGLLHYSFGGRGIYLSSFLSFNNTVNRLVPINEWMGGPTSRAVYFSEFPSIAASGLNPGFNWAGAFGYIFADLGWWTPLYLFLIGVFIGWLWRAFRAGTVAGVVLYPWAAFSILFWFGWNVLFDLRFAVLLVVVVTLTIYESCLARTLLADDVALSSPRMEVRAEVCT
ncbi:MAG TPA: hypothetical protein VGD59_08765 [Acidisarcina sp.]